MLSMAVYGQNQYAENLYRVVFAESRRHLVGGQWGNGSEKSGGTGYHWVPKYKHIKGWILERWDTARMSQREWDTTMIDPKSGWLVLGPYPSRGEYELAYEFGIDNVGMIVIPNRSMVDRAVGATERGRDRSFQDIQDAHKSEYAQEEKESSRERFDEIRDCAPAFGTLSAISSHGVSRGTKTVDFPTVPMLGRRWPRPQGKPQDLGGGVKIRSALVSSASAGR